MPGYVARTCKTMQYVQYDVEHVFQLPKKVKMVNLNSMVYVRRGS